MINVKVTFKNKTEDYIAVECETGAFVLPGAHVFGIFCIGIMFVGCLGQNPIRLQSYEKYLTNANK